jgi:hypothetical protein
LRLRVFWGAWARAAAAAAAPPPDMHALYAPRALAALAAWTLALLYSHAVRHTRGLHALHTRTFTRL